MPRVSERNEDPGGYGINGFIPGNGTCVATDCGASSVRGDLMCPQHWAMVPSDLRERLREVVAVWHRSGRVYDEMREAQWACVDALAAASVTPEGDQ
jgi:hypothetical protein